jgi:hypothetical protein
LALDPLTWNPPPLQFDVPLQHRQDRIA